MSEPMHDVTTWVDRLLAEQRALTAVDRFSAATAARNERPTQEKYYRELIPSALPRPGQQYAFEVDLDRCSGCKSCVTACHSLNGLDDHETWRSVGLLIGLQAENPRQQTITTSCHHCLEPACLEGCPVLAYHKDPITGIVRHLDDQCIGCTYCIMKCPYEVPQYSRERGIVRKCDMCTHRLADGEAPACVQGCPHEAIRIEIIDVESVRSRLAGSASGVNPFLLDSPDPAITLPTTRYQSSKPLSEQAIAADHAQTVPSLPHWPLVFMLVLTQHSVGALMASFLVENPLLHAFCAAVAGTLGLIAGALHLGKPLKMWRSFLGWRQSWLSREVIVLSAYMACLGVTVICSLRFSSTFLVPMTLAMSAILGLCGIACSCMIYIDTHREFWSFSKTFSKFFGTVLLLGFATMPAILGSWNRESAVLMALFTLAKLGLELFSLRAPTTGSDLNSVALKTQRLHAFDFRRVVWLRWVLALSGGILIPVGVAWGVLGTAWAAVALCLLMAGEIAERYLFFTCVVSVRMPGMMAP